MYKKLTSVLIALVFISLPSAVLSQAVSYAYDSSGNRIKREIRMNANKKPGCSGVDDIHVQETISERNVRIYPNPTKGMLKVEIVGYETDDTGQIDLFSLAGQHLFAERLSSESSLIDISGSPNGIYILQISINGKSTSWKIIKE